MWTLQSLELVISKTYLNLTKTFLLRLLKMAANQTGFQAWIEVCRKSLVRKKYKPSEIYNRMSDI